MELSTLTYFFRVLIEGNQGALPLRPQQGAALHPRRVFDPLDTLFAIALSALSCRVRVLMQGGASAQKHKLYIERNTQEQEKPAQHFAFTLVFSYIHLQCTLHQSS